MARAAGWRLASLPGYNYHHRTSYNNTSIYEWVGLNLRFNLFARKPFFTSKFTKSKNTNSNGYFVPKISFKDWV